MIIVSNTSPLNYLILIEQVQVLETLYGTVAIPEAVSSELQAVTTPTEVRAWMAALPSWCEVHSVTPPRDRSLSHLHAGEREAILLAQRLQADAVIIDERDGRNAAIERQLRVTGTLGSSMKQLSEGYSIFRKQCQSLKRHRFTQRIRFISSFSVETRKEKNWVCVPDRCPE